MCWCRPELRTPNCGRVECRPGCNVIAEGPPPCGTDLPARCSQCDALLPQGGSNLLVNGLGAPADGGTLVMRQAPTDAPRNVVIRTGAGFAGGRAGSFAWEFGSGEELLRVDPDGACFVRGKQVDFDAEFYKTVREWFAGAGVYSPAVPSNA